MRKKIVVPVVCAAVILAAAGGIFYWRNTRPVPQSNVSQSTTASGLTSTSTPNTEAAAGWLVYKNDQWDIAIKYPPDWTITEENNSLVSWSNKKELEARKNQNWGELWCGFWLELKNNEDGLPLVDWAIKNYGRPEDKELGKITEIKINGWLGIRYEFISMGTETHVLLAKDKNIVEISTVLNESGFCPNLQGTFNQILASLHFITN